MLDHAREVLDIEAAAIYALKDRLDDNFAKAVNLMIACKGRVVVTGMGKSGAIARKIAGTLSSTGTPSLFLHPAEGIHGDLGMVTPIDVVIALSNSGETDELTRILPILKRIGAKLVAMVGRQGSTLGKYSDVELDCTVEKEACPLGLAPTTSTTAMLALGDALALVAMRVRKFTEEDYALFHPGGSLGRRLTLRVADVMRTGDQLAIVNENDIVRDALFTITRAGAGAANVVNENGELTGILADGDLRRHVLADESCLHKPTKVIMTQNPKRIGPEALATEGVKILEEFKIGELPVIDESAKPVGMLMLKDLFKAGIV